MKSAVGAFITKDGRCTIDISLDDARNSGSYECGIRSWYESVGIDIARVQVPMAELREGFRRMPLTEVSRAVFRAVRRNRTDCTVKVGQRPRAAIALTIAG